jgi:phosphomannomutase
MSDLMARSGVKFGTSGARGLVSAMTDEICYAFTKAFLQSLATHDGVVQSCDVGIAGDLRSSTGRIMAAVARACTDHGHRPVHCGRIPTPAVGLFGIERRIPTVMVTGSHIPDDRNGIKFYKAAGEILKADEMAIRAESVALPDCFDDKGMFLPGCAPVMPTIDPAARQGYVRRYLEAFDKQLLYGKRIVVYQHSSVAREMLLEVLQGLGAEVVPVGIAQAFIPVDTEAIRAADVELAAGWAKEHQPFAVVSTDGDADRPLVSDEHGVWLRGDVAGILCAQFARADVVVTPVSSNTAVEKCGGFAKVVRTRIGSPYVIEEMERAARAGAGCVVGYEANGGVLTASPVKAPSGSLSPLPTRDALLAILGVLSLACASGRSISALLGDLPSRFTASDRLAEFPSEQGAAVVAWLAHKDADGIAAAFDGTFGDVAGTDLTDGLRITFRSGEILHLRPSGNAPELRCYAEADTEKRAREIAATGLAFVRSFGRDGRT